MITACLGDENRDQVLLVSQRQALIITLAMNLPAYKTKE